MRGVYFLANNGVLDLAIAFLNSFRAYNPDIPLCLIPFNSKVDRVAKLRSKYRFSIYDATEVLAFCDEVSLRFHPTAIGHYRKLAAWNGEFDEFIYIDVDTVVLRDVGLVFDFLASHSFVTSHSNIENIVKFVWKKSVYQSNLLTKEQIAFSANTGFIASQARALTKEVVKAKLERACALAPHMSLSYAEQPLLNYLFVTSGLPYTSLWALTRLGHPDVPLERWAGERRPGLEFRNGQIWQDGKQSSLLLMHWAGEWQPRWVDLALRTVLGKLKTPVTRLGMPHKKLWMHYRYLHEGL
jgi:hypothetical protein